MAMRSGVTFPGQLSEARRDELQAKFASQLVKIEDHLTNVESNNSDPIMDKLVDDKENHGEQIPDGEANHGESSTRPNFQNPSEGRSQESFFKIIQRTL